MKTSYLSRFFLRDLEMVDANLEMVDDSIFLKPHTHPCMIHLPTIS